MLVCECEKLNIIHSTKIRLKQLRSHTNLQLRSKGDNRWEKVLHKEPTKVLRDRKKHVGCTNSIAKENLTPLRSVSWISVLCVCHQSVKSCTKNTTKCLFYFCQPKRDRNPILFTWVRQEQLTSKKAQSISPLATRPTIPEVGTCIIHMSLKLARKRPKKCIYFFKRSDVILVLVSVGLDIDRFSCANLSFFLGELSGSQKCAEFSKCPQFNIIKLTLTPEKHEVQWGKNWEYYWSWALGKQVSHPWVFIRVHQDVKLKTESFFFSRLEMFPWQKCFGTKLEFWSFIRLHKVDF